MRIFVDSFTDTDTISSPNGRHHWDFSYGALGRCSRPRKACRSRISQTRAARSGLRFKRGLTNGRKPIRRHLGSNVSDAKSKHDNPCHMCDWRGNSGGGHCFMFEQEPKGICHKFRFDTDWRHASQANRRAE